MPICGNMPLLKSILISVNINVSFPSLCQCVESITYQCILHRCWIVPHLSECLNVWNSEKEKVLCFSFGFLCLRLSWFCGFVPGLREWPRKTNISVRGEGEGQYIPNPKPTCACNQLISWKSWKRKRWTKTKLNTIFKTYEEFVI